MNHFHRRFGVTCFVHNPGGFGEIHTMMSFHVHQLGTETDILQMCGQVGLIDLVQGRM